MTSKSDPGGHSGLKFCTHASFMGHYRYTNIHQNRRGLGTAVFDLTWTDPYSNPKSQEESKLRSPEFPPISISSRQKRCAVDCPMKSVITGESPPCQIHVQCSLISPLPFPPLPRRATSPGWRVSFPGGRQRRVTFCREMWDDSPDSSSIPAGGRSPGRHWQDGWSSKSTW